jgi:hypothetical protein
MLEDEQKSFHEQATIKDVSPARLTEPAWPPPPRPRPRQGPAKAIKVLAITLAALLVASGLSLVIYATTNQYNLALVAQQRVYLRGTVDSQATIARSLQATAQPLATTQAQIYASATAQDQATATVQASGDQATAAATAQSGALTQDTSGTPVVTDPLNDNTLNYNWDEGYTDNNKTGCNFVNGGYEVQEALKGFIHPCFAESTNFSNFVYQVSMTTTSGSDGGIIFCGNRSKGQYYFFRIDINGNYAFELYNGKAYSSLASGSSSAISTGLSQSNSLTVIANKGVFSLFVNSTYVASASDKTLKAGQIGMAVANTSLPVTADFTNAQVWTLS